MLERAGTGPGLAALFVTPPHAGALEDAARAVEATLEPQVLIGCAAESVAGPRREVEQAAAVALWTAAGVEAEPLALDGPELPGGLAPGSQALVLLADPFSFDAESFFERVEGARPGLPVVGGMASAARGPGGNRLVVGGTSWSRSHGGPARVTSHGAVGALVGRGVRIETVVSQGCRPVGQPWAVTRAEGNIVYELAGRPAMERLMSLARRELDDDEVAIINSGGLHLGRVIDEHRATFDRGDFLVRNVIGGDQDIGAIAVNDAIELGTTVQFHLRDAGCADEDLRALVAGRQAEAALLFTCNGRGTRLFGGPDHDASVVADALDDAPVAGFFAAGEFGPVGGRNFLHGFTASLALFGTDRAG